MAERRKPRDLPPWTDNEKIALVVVPLLSAYVLLTLAFSVFPNDHQTLSNSRDVPQSPGNYAAER